MAKVLVAGHDATGGGGCVGRERKDISRSNGDNDNRGDYDTVEILCFR